MSKQLRFFSSNLDSGGTIVHVGDVRQPDRVDLTLSEINAGIAANPGAPLEDVLIALLAERGIEAHMPERPVAPGLNIAAGGERNVADFDE